MFSRRRAAWVGGANIQLVGRKEHADNNMSTPGSTSLTTLVGGLDTQPATGDLILIGYTLADTANAALVLKSAGGTDYTLVDSELFANDNRDMNMRVAYRFAGGSPDTSFIYDDGYGGDSGATVLLVQVWRGVNAATPLDVAAVPATGTNTGQPNPGSITPVTAGAVIASFAAGSAVTGATPADLVSSDYTEFWPASRAAGLYASNAAAHGYKNWVGGAFDPSGYTGGSTSTADAWASMLVALRPA